MQLLTFAHGSSVQVAHEAAAGTGKACVGAAPDLHGIQQHLRRLLVGQIWQVIQEDGEADGRVRVKGGDCVIGCILQR